MRHAGFLSGKIQKRLNLKLNNKAKSRAKLGGQLFHTTFASPTSAVLLSDVAVQSKYRQILRPLRSRISSHRKNKATLTCDTPTAGCFEF